MRGIELGVMALLGLLVLFFGVRPLLRRVMGTDQAALAAGGVFLPGATVVTAAGAAASGGAGVLPATGVNVKGSGHGSITSTGGPNVALVGGDAHVNISNRTSAMIDIAQVQGQVHAESVQEGRRAGRAEPERNRRHHSHLAARKCGLRNVEPQWPLQQHVDPLPPRSRISSPRWRAASMSSVPRASSPARSAPRC